MLYNWADSLVGLSSLVGYLVSIYIYYIYKNKCTLPSLLFGAASGNTRRTSASSIRKTQSSFNVHGHFVTKGSSSLLWEKIWKLFPYSNGSMMLRVNQWPLVWKRTCWFVGWPMHVRRKPATRIQCATCVRRSNYAMTVRRTFSP